MTNNKCKHYGTMTLTPCEDRGWEILEWCFYRECDLKGSCPKNCKYEDKPDTFWEP